MSNLSPKEAVKAANKTTPADLAAQLQLIPRDDASPKFDLTVRKAPYTPAEKTAIWSIFASNMKALYLDSSFGWNPTQKKAELFHTSARYVVARAQPSTFAGEIAGYLGWRFVTDEDVDDNLVEVVYLYELSISSKHQKQGLGRLLVEGVEEIGRQQGMKKVLLTCLKKNVGAVEFYTRIGYTVDPTSPSQVDPEADPVEFDYEILSKTL